MTALIEKETKLPTPEELISSYPLPEYAEGALFESRQTIISILRRKDPRRLLIVGPCSLSDEESTLDYATRLFSLADTVKDSFFIVMRTYFEKGRTELGWKGLLHDPFRDGSDQIGRGLVRVRSLLCELAKQGLPLAAEILSPFSSVYFSDLLSFGCIGARTVTSQIHREMASSLPFAVGFKNTIDGNVQAAISAIKVANCPHSFLGLDERGQLAQIESEGNRYGALILRGGESSPNYDRNGIIQAVGQLQNAGLFPSLIVDCSHDNCQKDESLQKVAFESVMKGIEEGYPAIAGVMLESFINAGAQSALSSQYGLSLTDPCLGWEETEELILSAHQRVKNAPSMIIY